MAADDRKKRIFDHLAKSIDGVKYGTSRTTPVESTPSIELPPPPPIPQPVVPPSSPKSRKRQKMDHVKMSSGGFEDFSFGVEKRKQKIINHLRETQS